MAIVSSKNGLRNWASILFAALFFFGSIGSAQAVDPSLPLATGSFIQLNNSFAGRSPSWWQTELGAMNAVGMDTLVIQYVAFDNNYYYPTSVPGGSPQAVDSISRILTAADTYGMDVFLGVHFDPSPDSNASFNLATNVAKGQATMNELQTRYASYNSLAGWYMPQEISDFTIFSQPQLRDDLVSYTSSLKATASALASDLPLMISPYFGQSPDSQAYANWWDTTGLPQTGVDILALQDGVGTRRTTIAESLPVFQALAPVAASNGVAFWGNNESFETIHGWPVDNQPWEAVPADINTFKQQIQSTSPWVDKSITFEFSNYMSPQNSAESNALYQDYQAYYQSVIEPPVGTEQIDIASYTYDNPASTYFNGSAPDPSSDLLIDGDTGSTTEGSGSAFANGTWVGYGNDSGASGDAQPRVVFDLGSQQTVDSVELFYLVDAGAFIFAPQEVSGITDGLVISASTDGTNFIPVASSNNFVDIVTDQSGNAFEVRSILLDLNGVDASYLALEIHTPYTWIFLSEFQAFGLVAGLPGDFNNDGTVDAADYTVWRDNLNGDAAALNGNGSGGATVTTADYDLWVANFSNAAAASTSQSVPEPSALLLLGGSVLLLKTRSRKSLHLSN